MDPSPLSYLPAETETCGDKPMCRLGPFAPLRRQCFEAAFTVPCTSPSPGTALFIPSQSRDPRAYLSDVQQHFGSVTTEQPGVNCRWTFASRGNAYYPNECPSGKIADGSCTSGDCGWAFQNDNPRVVRPLTVDVALSGLCQSERETMMTFIADLSRGAPPRIYEVETMVRNPNGSRQFRTVSAIVVTVPDYTRNQCFRSIKGVWQGKSAGFAAAGDIDSKNRCDALAAGFLYEMVYPDGTMELAPVVILKPQFLAAAKVVLQQVGGKCL